MPILSEIGPNIAVKTRDGEGIVALNRYMMAETVTCITHTWEMNYPNYPTRLSFTIRLVCAILGPADNPAMAKGFGQ